MPKSYQYFIIAVFGWLILTAANEPSQATDKEKQQRIDQQHQANQQRAADNIADAIRETISAPEKDRGCSKAKENRNSDLCAQWKAADAARAAAEYSFFALIISAIGTGLLIWTFAETRGAARRGSRAYMMQGYSKTIPIETSAGRVWKFETEYINCGETPAYAVKPYAVLFFRDSPFPEDFTPMLLGTLDEIGAVGKGRNCFANTDAALPVSAVPSIVNGSAFAILYGGCYYKDVFGRDRETKVTNYISITSAGDGTYNIIFRPTNFHNSAN